MGKPAKKTRKKSAAVKAITQKTPAPKKLTRSQVSALRAKEYKVRRATMEKKKRKNLAEMKRLLGGGGIRGKI